MGYNTRRKDSEPNAEEMKLLPNPYVDLPNFLIRRENDIARRISYIGIFYLSLLKRSDIKNRGSFKISIK